MDVVLLRKLTEKSKLGFGKYGDQPIWYILQNNHTQYLRYIYYSCSGITFMEDILRKIGIKECEEIEKPGTNVELRDKISKRKFAAQLHHARDISEKEFIIKYTKIRRLQKKCKVSNLIAVRNSNKALNGKQRLQGLNHGKFKN